MESRERARIGIIVAATAAVLLVMIVAQVRYLRDRERRVSMMRSMREYGRRLESHREANGAYPCPGVSDIGECDALSAEGPVDPFDARGRSIRLVVSKDGAHALVTSPGKDGRFDADVGGPIYEAPWRDLVLLDGSWFQYPQGYQCGWQCRGTIREWVARDREAIAETWRGDDLRSIRDLHATLVPILAPR